MEKRPLQRNIFVITLLSILYCTYGTQLIPCSFDCMYPDNPVIRVMRSMKELHAMMTIIKEKEEVRKNVHFAQIIEIQLLNVCASFSDFARALQENKEVVTEEHSKAIFSLWSSVCALAKNTCVATYFSQYDNPMILPL